MFGSKAPRESSAQRPALSTFVMISQNRQTERSEVQAEIHFENNGRAEVWSVHIGHALGLDVDHIEHIVGHVIDGYRAEQTLRQDEAGPVKRSA
jgi:uncharacterized membrane protein